MLWELTGALYVPSSCKLSDVIVHTQLNQYSICAFRMHKTHQFAICSFWADPVKGEPSLSESLHFCVDVVNMKGDVVDALSPLFNVFGNDPIFRCRG